MVEWFMLPTPIWLINKECEDDDSELSVLVVFCNYRIFVIISFYISVTTSKPDWQPCEFGSTNEHQPSFKKSSSGHNTLHMTQVDAFLTYNEAWRKWMTLYYDLRREHTKENDNVLVLGEWTGDGKKWAYTSSLILGVRIGGSTSMPIFAAVPAMILIADSTLEQFKSGNFSIAMVRNWSIVTFPTFSSFGSFEPFSAPARLFSSLNQFNKLAFIITFF